jgi:hypothetical protein
MSRALLVLGHPRFFIGDDTLLLLSERRDPSHPRVLVPLLEVAPHCVPERD